MCFHDTAEAQNSSAIPEFDTFGTLRTVFTTDQIRAQDGTRGESSALNARIHLGARATFSDRFYLQSRFATRLSTTQSDFRFFVRDYTPGGGSYPAGTATIDELFAAWDAADRLHIRVGRFQGRFPLEGFIPKGMDRYYAANLSISHTDGVWLRQDLSYRYRLHFIASRNSERGSSHAARRPLSFSDSASRYTLFANLEHRNKSGLWAQRELSVSYTRNNFVRDGSLKDHLTFSGRAMARLPFNPGTGEYLIGGELGFIPLAPDPSSGGIAVSEDNTMFGSSSVAWQLSAYANKLFDKHYLGILYGQTDPHWFVSSSFTPNTTMSEIRYRFVISSSLNYEMRFRIRTDLFKPENAPFTTRINDFYARFTYRF
ncbi:MAG: hypothetical protein LAT84_11265 [Balneolia bacterium]|nr:hypothetical protein [Balneolia bacterium]